MERAAFPLRDEIAAMLLDRDEGGGHLGWARNLINAGKSQPHGGDCTKQSYTCVVCLTDEALAAADAIIAIVRADGAVGGER